MTKHIPVTTAPWDVVYAARALWSSADGGVVDKIDPSRNRVVRRLKLPGKLRGVAWAFGSVWVGSQTGTVAFRIDPRTTG